MTYTVKKLTRQWNGHAHFKWVIQCDICDENANRRELSAWREWCWKTWGPSRELLWATTTCNPIPCWAWDTEFRHRRLYLKSDAELTLFQLKF